MNLNASECLIASKSLLDNAESLYNDSKLLSINGSYGHATSLLIQSTEESMKALILFLDGNGFQFRSRVSGINNLFINHKLRYGLAMFLSILYIFSKDIKDLIQKIKGGNVLTFDFKKDKKKAEVILLPYTQNLVKIIIKEILWFSQAEFTRQEGFYVDYIDEIRTPLQISKIDFENVLARLDRMRSFVTEYIQSFESTDEIIIQGISNLKQLFINENWYEKIGEVIKSFKEKSNNPLANLSSILIDFSKELDDIKSLT